MSRPSARDLYVNNTDVAIGGSGTATTGYSGAIDRVTNVYWESPDLKQTKVTYTYENGLLKTVGSPVSTTVTTAVPCP